ncbi:hypothetical protein EB118_07790 [bacterium]|nr:hypothetical protein [bacterium]NDC95163.1 hypothetical protein [bacterium]NDD84839.1 hypothetical protein [bacterium]NDG29979.1 hypothetical protein [bacterium]
MKIYYQLATVYCGGTIITAIVLLCLLVLNPLHEKNIKKTHVKFKLIDRQKIISTELTGNVESIHPWGRTEIVPMKSIELEYFEFCNEWVMYGDVVQPVGRKDYFMPVMRGTLNLNVKDFSQTWVEHSKFESGLIENPETFEDFRVANFRIKEGEIIDINYLHYRLLSDRTWNIIASWKAIVNPDIPYPVPANTQKNNAPLIICSFCRGTGERIEDTNLIWRDAKMALWLNKHLMSDKCTNCIKSDDNKYKYCDEANKQYEIYTKEYEKLGPKMEKTSCSGCMGMGQFSSFDTKKQRYITQEEYEQREPSKVNN